MNTPQKNTPSTSLEKQLSGCCTITPSCCDSSDSLQPGIAPDSAELTHLWIKIAISLILGGQAMMFGLGVNTTPPEPFSFTFWIIHGAMLAGALVAMILLGPPLFKETFKSIKNKKITVEALFTLSVTGAFVGSLISTLRGSGDVYYEVVAIVLSIYTIGKTLGLQSRRKALEEVEKVKNAFNTAYGLKTKNSRVGDITFSEDTVEISVKDLKIGDTVLVGPGQSIPVDGVIVKGQALIQETAITGEPAALAKHEGDLVFAGTFSVDGTLIIQNQVEFGKRIIDQVLTTVENAQLKPARLQETANKLMQWFLPLVLFFSIGGFSVWMYIGHWDQALFNAMAVLLVACPCALGLATPLAIWTVLWRLSKMGLVCRSGAFLDVLANAKRVVFDKTGTLSESGLYLDSFILTHKANYQSEQLEAMLTLAQTAVDHPVARAIKDWLHDESLDTPSTHHPKYELIRTQVVPAKGLQAWLKGPNAFNETTELHLKMGELNFMDQEALDFFNQMVQPDGAKKCIYLSINGEPTAILTFREHLREGVDKNFQDLKELGLAITILTGDSGSQWKNIEGIEVEQGLSPEAKRMRLESFQNAGEKVIFVGDGVNDASAMALADGSIAICSGASLTKATSSSVLLGQNLHVISQAIQLARKMQHNIHDNMIIALFYNVIGMSLAAMGILHPVVAALLMLVSSAIVSWRAATLKL